MSHSLLLAGPVIAGLCVGDIPAKMEHHLIEDMRYCTEKSDSDYEKCMDGSLSLFHLMFRRFSTCFDDIIEANTNWYSDAAFVQIKFSGQFRGRVHSFSITQVKKTLDEESVANINEALTAARRP